jgi:acetolactate synthase-1/2/3 large subunit
MESSGPRIAREEDNLSPMTSVEAFAQALSRHGVEWIATLCGHGLDPLFSAADQAGIRLIDTRNEQTASYIADAYGKLTGRPGVCAVSSGIAHVNALSGVVNAWFDGTPMLLVSGSAALRTEGMGHFQDMDQVTLAASITRFARTIDHPDRSVQLLEEALSNAVGPPPGPVHLTFPMDIQRAEVGSEGMLESAPVESSRRTLDPGPVVSAISKANAPLIVAGSGIWYAGENDALMQFSERYSIPVVVPIWDRGSIARPVKTFMGVIGAATGGPELLADADCIVLAGVRSDYRVRFLEKGAMRDGARVVSFESGWAALESEYERQGGKVHSEWLDRAIERRDVFRQNVAERGDQQARAGLHAVHIVATLKEVITDDTMLLIDGGSIGQWAHHLLCDRYPGHWLTCGRSGVIGWGIGGAMASRLVFPDRPVILLSGDGSFTFNVADLECAARQRLPFVAIVADDQSWGITQTGHVKAFGKPIGSSLGPIAFAKLAESLGAKGVTATTADSITAELRSALQSGEVTVIHVPIIGGNPS